ncbi:MAG: septum formation initiator family protein [Alphaproteobacteria bacterium]|nr:septum formation initiator family protein [Alphaproteobacteria bacterium]
MKSIRDSSFRIRKVIAILLLLTLIFYFLYNILSGDRGILALFELSERHKILQDEVQILEEERSILQNKVSRMRSDSLDLDLLEEQARKKLGYGRKGETVYVD